MSSSPSSGITQSRGPGPLGQFKIRTLNPIVPFFTMLYFRAQRILTLARSSSVFHMLNLYLARQALHLVILLNDFRYQVGGLDGRQMDEREVLEDELVDLETAMRDWSTIQGFQDTHGERTLTIKTFYNHFFRERFYFEHSQDPKNDTIYQRLLAYDTRATGDFNDIPEGASDVTRNSPISSLPSQISGLPDREIIANPDVAVIYANNTRIPKQQKDAVATIPPLVAQGSEPSTSFSKGPVGLVAGPTDIPNPMATPNEASLCFLHPDGNGVRILALDGGDTRCFSQLLMLGELMRRLEYDHGRSIRPCEFFHSMTGVGASGVIAILLGVLGLTAEDAAKAFSSICRKVFAEDVCNETYRSEILATEIEEVLEMLNIAPNTRLEGSIDRSAGCLVSICYSSAAIQSCRMFRNYPSRHFSHNPTIVEAARASWATPGLFSSIHVGSHPTHGELVSAVNGFNNTTFEAVREVREIFGVDRALSSFLSLGSGKRLPVSIYSDGHVQSKVLDIDDVEEACERDFGPSGVYYRVSPEHTIRGERFGVESNQLSSIKSYTSVYLERVEISRTLESYLRISGYTSDSDLGFRAIAREVATHSKPPPPTSRLSPEERSILSELGIAGRYYLSPIERCMKGTRENILESINDWTMDFDAPNILWLKGHPGVGKSAIAAEVVEQLSAMRRLGSSFFFQRQKSGIVTPHALWRTVAYDLARRHPTTRRIMVAKLENKEVNPATISIEMLFRHFIHDPLIGSMGVPASRSPVVVIDALDECGGLEGQYSTHRRHLIETLRNWSRLPRKFKLIVTSRAENDIDHLFSETIHHHIEISAGQTADVRSSSDIRIFLKKRFRQITEGFPGSLSPSWPEPQTINELTDRAAGLFIWAETVVKFITLGEPQQRLRLVLEGGETGDIDELYKRILSTVFLRPSAKDIIDLRSVVGTIIFAKASLSFSSLAQLLSTNESTVVHICNALQSILDSHHMLDSRHMLEFHHQSFVDFILNKAKCPQEYLIDPHDQHHSLTLACIRTMRENLRFNICDIKSSYVRNDDIPDLTRRANKRIPAHLLYSSCWWASHLSEIEFDTTIFDHLQHFMRKQFLSWLEVLSMKKQVNLGSQMLILLVRWIPVHREDEALEMAIDMQKFVATFASVISKSVAHIYVSCLPFSPRSSTVWKQYTQIYGKTSAIQMGGLSTWPALQKLLVGHSDSVRSVVFSPDGRHVASGSNDHTIRIWDAETGHTVTGPLEGHSGWVNSVAFSPDGRRVASGSANHTIRIWNAETGQTVTRPLRGHSGQVRSVAFSPDGRRVASGSDDNTIRIWNAETGQAVGGPLEGHSNWVNSVAFSPDGRCVASGSSDHTIRIWDAEAGFMVMGPLMGHSSSVCSVTFSQDGRRVVSGSSDQTIRIWDAETGHTVTDPLQGHIGWVNSVMFSPDGRRLVSGSSDHTIRIWDVYTGCAVGRPLEGHSGTVFSVAFSPDGRRVASGSLDRTIRIWDAQTGPTVTDPLEGHSNSVCSVRFSPDGRRVVSGSDDNTIRIWDAERGHMVTGPLEGHSDWINSVAFSPDGRHVVSGSDDQTIRIWDAETGQTVTRPLRGHSGQVRSVAFSPDGRHVVSGSDDQTIRIWNAETGQTVGDPLKGHSNWVNSVAFSPDGRRVASGSADHTIRIWDVYTGCAVGRPLEGHSGTVFSVAFSPDGRRVVSGSLDRTIRIWDVETGQKVGGPLEGHSDWVNSVAFSPDGRRVVSGSADRTIRIWDADTGHMLTGPLRGHSEWVSSVAFSPDGRCVVSGSKDHTIRIWNAETGHTVTGPLQGHSGWDKSVVFSPDRSAVVSSSKDFTVRGFGVDVRFSKNLGQSRAIFNDSSPVEDGWVLGPNSELLFWVPPSLRVGLLRPGNKLFIGKFVQTRINLDSFAHGDLWTRCEREANPGDEGILDGDPFATHPW